MLYRTILLYFDPLHHIFSSTFNTRFAHFAYSLATSTLFDHPIDLTWTIKVWHWMVTLQKQPIALCDIIKILDHFMAAVVK